MKTSFRLQPVLFMVMILLASRFALAQEDLPFKKVLTLHTHELTSSDVFHISKQLEKVRGIYFWEYSSIDHSLIVTYENGKIQESAILQFLNKYTGNNDVAAKSEINTTAQQQEAIAESPRFPAMSRMKLRSPHIMTAPFRYEIAVLEVKKTNQSAPAKKSDSKSNIAFQPEHAETNADHSTEALQPAGDFLLESEKLEKLISIHYLGNQTVEKQLLLTSGADTLVISSMEESPSIAHHDINKAASGSENSSKALVPAKKELLIQTDELTNFDVYRISKQLETLEGVDFWGYHADMQTLLISYEPHKISDTAVIFKLIGNIKKDACLKELTSESFFAFIDKADKLVK